MPEPIRILVVDDELAQRELVSGFLKKQGFEVAVTGSGEKALELFRQETFDLVLTDQKMPNMSGLDLLQAIHAINPETAVVLMTAYGSIESAVSSIKGGATDYLTKPLNLDELLYRIRKVSERYQIINENRELREALQGRHRIEGIIGESGQMLEVISLVRRAAPSEATVLIRGESGTGKELIAKAIHFASPRASGPLVKVNCAALPETLLESELFGHEKGAFTGAVTSRQGRFELANGGNDLSSTKLAIFLCICRRSSCVSFKSANTRRWAPAVRSRSMSGSWLPATGRWRRSLKRDSCGRISTIGLM